MNLNPRGFDFLKDVDVRLSVELGRADMKLRDVLAGRGKRGAARPPDRRTVGRYG
jgi:hypothetical protein